jgi:putative transposase
MDVHVSEISLARYSAVSQVLAKVAGGASVRAAIGETLQKGYVVLPGDRRIRVSPRTLFRWVSIFNSKGFGALAPVNRKSASESVALQKPFLDFLKSQKIADKEATIPDIIRSAVLHGIVKDGEVSRTTAWRAALRANLPLMGIQKKSASTKRRFEYKHRMQMVLCDGKQFRTGAKRRKRVVFSFIDDSTRKILGVVVCRAENKRTFLRGLYKVILRHGKMQCLYLDNGCGFISKDGYLICARLGIHIINGTERYPEGHGKIERYNRTQFGDLLRTFAGDTSVDSSFESLELRIQHYAFNEYNERFHESLKKSPNEKWKADSLPLNIVADKNALAREFVVTKKHKVSSANTISSGGELLEMPFGYAGQQVDIMYDLLHKEARFLHEGKAILLKSPNLVANSKEKRSGRNMKRLSARERRKRFENSTGPIMTAARLSFEKDYLAIVSRNGDFFEKQQD